MNPDEQIPKERLAEETGNRVTEVLEEWPGNQVDIHNGIMSDSADRLIVANCREALDRAIERSILGHR